MFPWSWSVVGEMNFLVDGHHTRNFQKFGEFTLFEGGAEYLSAEIVLSNITLVLFWDYEKVNRPQKIERK